MNRTTIVLPPNLKHRAIRFARHMGLSLGELIRQSLENRIRSFSEPTKDPFWVDLKEAHFFKGGPKDLSSNVDKYLYGELK